MHLYIHLLSPIIINRYFSIFSYFFFFHIYNSTLNNTQEKVKQKTEGTKYAGEINVGENYQVSNVSTFFLNSHSEKYDGAYMHADIHPYTTIVQICYYIVYTHTYIYRGER